MQPVPWETLRLVVAWRGEEGEGASGGWRASLVLQCKACLLVVRADWLAARPGGVFWLVGDVQGRVKDSPSVHLRVNISSLGD